MNCYQVDYINPVYGTTMPRFHSVSIEKDKKLPPSTDVRMLRAKYIIDLAAVTLFYFRTPPSGSLIVPWNLLYHKNLRNYCSVSGTFNPVSHATYLLQKLYPHLDFTSEEVLTQIDQFVPVTTYINGQLKTDIKNYYHYWIFKLFQECCDVIGLTRRQEVTNFENAGRYAGDDIKACFILEHVIKKIKDAFTSY
jgi:hypothetical protein